TNVADRKNPRHRRFQRRVEPPLPCLVMGAGDHESSAVDLHPTAGKPAGCGIGADEQEEVADLQAALFTGKAAAPAHPLQGAVMGSGEAYDFAVEHQFDVGGRLDPIDEIARHAGAKAAAANNQIDLAG